MVGTFKTFKETDKLFSKVTVQCYILSSSVFSPHPHQHLVWSIFEVLTILIGIIVIGDFNLCFCKD